MARPKRMFGRCLPLAWLLLAVALAANAAEFRGVVFEDRNDDGHQNAGEAGVPGLGVSNGRDVVQTNDTGAYTLPARGSFVALTRRESFSAATWYREGGGDFALQPGREIASEFFFIQISDAHVFEDGEDLLRWSIPERPWWMPEPVGYGLARWLIGSFYPDRPDEDFDAKLRAELPSSASNLSGGYLLQAYLDEFGRPGSSLGAVADPIRASFDEVFGLEPSFVIHTGDLLLESNNATPEVASRWLAFYHSLVRNRGIPVFDTIGNNEIVGSDNDDVSPADPDFGTGLWKRLQGPTHFSWDWGDFHFVALDTHRPKATFLNAQAWTFGRMRDSVRTWLDEDLALHHGRTQVVLNHEPFLLDPSWPFDDEDQLASDEGLFAKHEVAYVLSGHTHFNGRAKAGATEHITTGALSGFRWLLPTSLHPRGFRLWYARNGRLHSAWKPTGEAILVLTEPARSGKHPILAAADRGGPFENLKATQTGKPVRVDRWGAYFARIEADPADGPIYVEALSTSQPAGTVFTIDLLNIDSAPVP